MNAKRAGDAGLSLIEVLVSLAIFAVIGVAGLTVLDTVARTGENTEGRLERLAEIDRSFLVIRRDLAQIAPSEVTLTDNSLSFARAHGDRTRSIAYFLEGETLVRQVKTGTGSGPVDQRLLVGVSALGWRLMDRGQRWHDAWPPNAGATVGAPMAAELAIDVWQRQSVRPATVTRLMVLPAGQSQ
jgi:general secretion pathway protein J